MTGPLARWQTVVFVVATATSQSGGPDSLDGRDAQWRTWRGFAVSCPLQSFPMLCSERGTAARDGGGRMPRRSLRRPLRGPSSFGSTGESLRLLGPGQGAALSSAGSTAGRPRTRRRAAALSASVASPALPDDRHPCEWPTPRGGRRPPRVSPWGDGDPLP